MWGDGSSCDERDDICGVAIDHQLVECGPARAGVLGVGFSEAADLADLPGDMSTVESAPAEPLFAKIGRERIDTFGRLHGKSRRKRCWMARHSSAMRCKVDCTTAFRWRHRFLAALNLDKPQRLPGFVEADETFVLAGAASLKALTNGATPEAWTMGAAGLGPYQQGLP